jgi:hypothetical protein
MKGTRIIPYFNDSLGFLQEAKVTLVIRHHTMKAQNDILCIPDVISTALELQAYNGIIFSA